MIQVLLYPDALSLVGSMNAFEIYNESKTDVVFALRYHGAEQNIVQHTYTPNDEHRITVDVKDIILPLLAFELKDDSTPYVQENIMKAFSAEIYEVVDAGNKKEFSFSVIRAGVDKLADSAENFLKNNFLTWQPQVKAVTYYSPEFLTYYAAEACAVKCKAYLWNGTGYTESEITLAHLTEGCVYTIPVQYAIIAKALNQKTPSYYDVWVEKEGGDRLTYVQRYYASDMKSEEEEWFLFENSLGGVDCFRAYGNSENTAEHTHNVAEIEDDSEEYRVDTTRKFKKNTGYLDGKERLWLLDFFPSLGKYVYHRNSWRKITVTESDVNYEAKELPSNYTFTYRYSDARPYLNLSRASGESLKQMDIHLPDIGNFTIAPRLVEFPRQQLGGGVLFPVQDPHSEEWGTTTADAIFLAFLSAISNRYSGKGEVGHKHINISVLDALSFVGGYLLYKGEKLKAGVADVAKELDGEAAILKKYIRRDIDDTAEGTITFEKVQKLLGGLLVGENFSFDKEGNIIAHSIASENANEAGHKGFSIIQTGSKTGKYKLNINELLAFSKAKVGDKFVFDAANDFRFDADGNIIAHSIASENANEAGHKGFSIIQTDPNTGKYKLNIDELLAFSKATIMKQAKIGDKFVFDVERDFRFDVEGNIIAHSISSDGASEENGKGFTILQKDPLTNTYKLCIDEVIAYTVATVGKLFVNGNSRFGGELSSKQFISGFLGGLGWGIYNTPVTNAAGVQENKWTGEFDNVIVRGSLRVFEMIISQLLGENDNRIFTGMMEVDHYDAESGRVYLNTQDGKLYNPFRRNDIIMVQQFNGMPNSSNDYYVTKNYELLITDAGCGSLEDGDKRLDWVTFTNFTSSMEDATAESLIKKKDTFVRVDNLSDSQRKGIIQLMTVGANTPYMDIIYGLKTDPNNALKGRLGNLKGIVHPILGELSGFGEFLNNLYAVGDFIIQRTGESVDSKLQVLENMFSIRFSQTSYELTNSDNYLENGQFLEQVRDDEDTIISCWAVDTTDESMFWADALGNPFMVNGLLSVSGNRKVSIDKMDGRQVLRLQNCGVKQLNAHIRQPGTHKEYQQPSGSTGDNGLKKPATGSTDVQDRLYISIRIFAKTAGTLTVGFEGCSSVSGKSNTLTAQNVAVPYSGDWTNIPLEGVWNGTGNFVLRYTGDCYIAIASITDKPLSEFSKSVSTQIKQTATNIQLLGENINKVNGKTTQLGIELDAEKGEIRQYVDTKDKKNREDTSSLITQTSSSITSSVDKKLKNQYDTITSEYSSSITQKADQITLKVSAAQTAADNAQSAADAAQGTADTAIKKNAELKVTVDGIGSNVDTKIANAKGEITKEYTSAINQSAKDITLKVSAAQTAADNAQSAANAAQGTADTAINKNAELKVTVDGIGSKVDTKIANAKGEITKEYTSAINQSAKDITLKVSAAQTAADNAQSAANAAQGTADTAKKSVAELKVTMDGISTTVANKADTSTLNSKVSELNTSISSAKKSAIDTVNARIDGGVAEFYQQASPPSFTNLGWTKAECQRHAGALWYVVEPGTKGYVTGHLYRFVVMRGTGGAWEDVDDSIDSATTVQQNASGWNVASGMFDAKGNLTASGVASITPTVTTISNTRFDEKWGEIKSGYVATGDFARFFSQACKDGEVVTSAQISTFITKDETNKLISNATIQADQINLTGHTMAFTGGQITITTDNFTLDGSGNMWCKNGTFSGTVTGVQGSFKKLDCVDNNGNVVGSIKFDSNGRLWFSGDMYHQGYDSDKKRGYRFYAADIWCRGMFGHRQKTVAYVFNTYMAIYTNDSDDVDHYVMIPLESGTESGKTYNKIPLYGFADYGDASGFAIDVVVINSSSDFYYVFEGMGNGKEWRVINGNDKQTIHFADIGGWHELKGGESLSCVYVVPRLLSPTPSGLGAGVFWSGEADLNWS